MQVLLILALILALTAVIFAVQNAMPVTVSFLFWQFANAPLALVLLLVVGLGLLMSLLVSVPSLVGNRWTISRLKKRVAELEKSVQEQQARVATLEASLAEARTQLESAQKKLGGSNAPVAPHSS
ncbi:MAG: lipopolysaccharide assembly protein LapA domain-containing protein [Anaerolineales bacterium]|nr:lipopolysaccharide assembly protein LapA domain-containing protein [Anaerolineales bacterium]